MDFYNLIPPRMGLGLVFFLCVLIALFLNSLLDRPRLSLRRFMVITPLWFFHLMALTCLVLIAGLRPFHWEVLFPPILILLRVLHIQVLRALPLLRRT